MRLQLADKIARNSGNRRPHEVKNEVDSETPNETTRTTAVQVQHSTACTRTAVQLPPTKLVCSSWLCCFSLHVFFFLQESFVTGNQAPYPQNPQPM